MKMRNFLLMICLLAPAPLFGQNPSKRADQDAIRAVVAGYIHGLKFNDTTSLKQAFLPEAHLFFRKRDGTLGDLTQEKWYSGFRDVGKEQQGEITLQQLQIAGTIASAKVREKYPDSIYTNFLTLVKIGDRWWIVSKAFYAEKR